MSVSDRTNSAEALTHPHPVASDLCYLNNGFLTHIRNCPDSGIIILGDFSRESHRATVAAINALSPEQAQKMCDPLGSLLFSARISDDTTDLSADTQHWLEDYWGYCWGLAQQSTVARFTVLTGLDVKTYNRLLMTPLHGCRHWASKTQVQFRHPPKLWALILDLVASGKTGTVAPILGVYSSMACIEPCQRGQRSAA